MRKLILVMLLLAVAPAFAQSRVSEIEGRILAKQNYLERCIAAEKLDDASCVKLGYTPEQVRELRIHVYTARLQAVDSRIADLMKERESWVKRGTVCVFLVERHPCYQDARPVQKRIAEIDAKISELVQERANIPQPKGI